jgi:multiple sugar transport system ATP-binding protein
VSTVATREITKVFDRRVRAVDAISLTAREGEFLVLLGPSGCGKTTLMRMIAGLERPSGGDVLIGDEVVTALPPRARNVAMVFQSYALYPHLTVERNISFPLRAQGMDRAAIRKKVEWAAGMFGITRLLERKPRQLSGGERQRVALARAVVREPVVFLLDEPLSNLDAKLRTAARDELKEFQHRLGTTTIYVTHDQIEAMGLGDRIAVLDQGRVRQVGTPSAIYHEPEDTFVATFIGAPPMNLVEQDGAILGFRPEHFLPEEIGDLGAGGDNAERTRDAAVAFPVRVTRVEYLGADQLIYGVLEAPFPETHVISRLPWMARFTPGQGERHDFVVREIDLKRFAVTTGRRIDGAGGD